MCEIYFLINIFFYIRVRDAVRLEQLPDRLWAVAGYEEVDLGLFPDELRSRGAPEHRLYEETI